jgi:hypothetical protein
MQLSVPFRDKLAEFILLRLGQFIKVDAVQKAFGQDFLHQLSFVQAVAGAGATFRGADHGSQTCLMGHGASPSLTGFHRIWMSW